MKGESVKSIAGRTRNELIGNGDAICVYLTSDGALHSSYVSDHCIYFSAQEDIVKMWYYDKPTKMATIRDNAVQACKEYLNNKYGRGSDEDFK